MNVVCWNKSAKKNITVFMDATYVVAKRKPEEKIQACNCSGLQLEKVGLTFSRFDEVF